MRREGGKRMKMWREREKMDIKDHEYQVEIVNDEETELPEEN